MNLKNKIKILFIIEILLIVFFILTGYKRYKLLPNNYQTNFMESRDDRYYIKDGIQLIDKKITILSINYGYLSPGTYRGYVSYSGKSHGEQYLRFDCSNNDYIQANNVILDYRLNSESFLINITHPVQNFSVLVDYQGDPEFSLNLQFYRSRIGMVRNCVAVVLVFSVIELGLFYFSKNSEKKNTVLLLIIFSIFAFLPYLLMGVYPGHDFEYHILRIESIVEALKCGQFPVYMNPLFIGNYGYPVSVYYCDLFLYIPVFFRVMGFSINTSYKIFVLIINILTAFIAYKSFGEIFKKEKIAILLTFAYLCAPYRLMDIYVRSAVGEFCAYTFLPMVCAGFYGICMINKTGPSDNQKEFASYRKSILYLSLGMSGILLSHILTTEMVITFLLIISLLLCKRLFIEQRIKAIAYSVLHFVFICLFFIVPFLDFYTRNDIEIKHAMENTIPSIQVQGLQIGELFMFFKDIFGAGGADVVLKDRFYLSIGLSAILSLIVAFVFICKNRSTPVLKFLFIISLLSLFLSSNLFPWNTIAYYSKIGVILSQVQFPWRFLTIATVLCILIMGELFRNYDFFSPDIQINISGNHVIHYNLGIILISSLVFLETTVIFSNYSSNITRVKLYNTNDMDIGEVRPFHVIRYDSDIRNYMYQIHTEKVAVKVLKQNGFHWNLYCETGSEDGIVTMPLLNYEGYKVKDEFGNSYEIFDGPNKEISFTLPNNYEGKVSVYYQASWYWYASLFVSFIYIIILLVYILKKLERKKKEKF